MIAKKSSRKNKFQKRKQHIKNDILKSKKLWAPVLVALLVIFVYVAVYPVGRFTILDNPEKTLQKSASVSTQKIAEPINQLVNVDDEIISHKQELIPYKGYIIQLQKPNIIENFQEDFLKVQKTGLPKNQMTSALHREIIDYKRNIENDHANAMADFSRIVPDIASKKRREFISAFNGFSFDVSEEEIKKLKDSPYVKAIYPNTEAYVTLDESVPLIRADEVWELQDELGRNITGIGIKIAIIDTGVDYTHPDLGGCFGEGCKVMGGYDFYNDDSDPMDDHGHGTHVAGIAAGEDGNNVGLKGVAPSATLYAYKVLNEDGSGNFDDIIAAIETAMDPNHDFNYSDHLDVISMSLGGRGTSDDPLAVATDNAVIVGSVAVVAAGNSGPEGNNVCRKLSRYGYYSICTPGTSRRAITIGASLIENNEEMVAGFSSRGPALSSGMLPTFKPDLVAPGVNICSSQWDDAWSEYECVDDEHTSISGTSMATPHVAGAVALLKQAHPDWTSEEIKSSLQTTARVLTFAEMPFNVYEQGGGRIDVYEAVTNDIIILPSALDFGLINGVNQTWSEMILKNSGNMSRGIRFNDYFDYNILIDFQEETLCLFPDDERNVTLIATFINNSFGLFSERATIEVFNNCEFVAGEENLTIAVSYLKLPSVHITFHGKVPDQNEHYYFNSYIEPYGGDFFDLAHSFIEPPAQYGVKEANGETNDINTSFKILRPELFSSFGIVSWYRTITTDLTTQYRNMFFRKEFPDPLYDEQGNLYYEFFEEDVPEIRSNIKDILQYKGLSLRHVGIDFTVPVNYQIFDDLGEGDVLINPELLPDPAPDSLDAMDIQIRAFNDLNKSFYYNLEGIENVLGENHSLRFILHTKSRPQGIPSEDAEVWYALTLDMYDNFTYNTTILLEDISSIDLYFDLPFDRDLDTYKFDIRPHTPPFIQMGLPFGGGGWFLYTGFPIKFPADYRKIWYNNNQHMTYVITTTGYNAEDLSNNILSRIQFANTNYNGKIIPLGNSLPDELHFNKRRIFPEIIAPQTNIGLVQGGFMSCEEWGKADCKEILQGVFRDKYQRQEQNSSIMFINRVSYINTSINSIITITNPLNNVFTWRRGSLWLHCLDLPDGCIEGNYTYLWNFIDEDRANITLKGTLFFNVSTYSDPIWGGSFYYGWEHLSSNLTCRCPFGEACRDDQLCGIVTVKNPSFEIDVGRDYYPEWNSDDATAENLKPDGWYFWGSGEMTEEHSHTGTSSIQINDAGEWVGQDIPVRNGKNYLVSGYVKTNCLEDNCYGTIITKCMNSNHQEMSCSLTIPASQWTRIYGTSDWREIKFTVRSDNPSARFLRVLCAHTPTEGDNTIGKIFCDDFNVYELPSYGGKLGLPYEQGQTGI